MGQERDDNPARPPTPAPAAAVSRLSSGASWSGDVWGGLAAMLVALPSAIAFGVAIFSVLGAGYASQGALAGMLGTVVLGLVAPLLGGAPRLITAPCAPAAAVMTALAAELLVGSGSSGAGRVVTLLAATAVLAGGLQLAFGLLRGGRLMKYIPYPVVSGYLSGVGVIIALGQLPKLLGLPKGLGLWDGLLAPGSWQWPSLVVGTVTIAGMVTAPYLTRRLPAAILGLAAGLATYFALGLADASLWTLEGNGLVIGRLGGAGVSLADAVSGRWSGLGQLALADLGRILVPALTLAVLLSIDTLKTGLVVDALTGTRHDSNRELLAQGVANVASALGGGIPGAGTMGPTLVSVSSGGRSRRAGVLEGAFALAAVLLLGSLIAWVPLGALAGILLVVAFRMFDRSSFRLLRQRSTALDFAVVAAVVVVAATVGLIAAAGVGLGLAILLFIREQIRGSVIRRRVLGNQVFSKQCRLPDDAEVLLRHGDRVAICELQGSLFFGTADQLLTELDRDLVEREIVILDLRRVTSVDFSGAHMLERIGRRLAERGAQLLLSHLPRSLPSGQDVQAYLGLLGVVRESSPDVRVFDELDQALEWAEDRVLEQARGRSSRDERPLDLAELDLLAGRREETVEALRACVEERSYAAGDTIFRRGDAGDELFLVRRGQVQVELRLEGGKSHRLASFQRGDFFGDMAFLDRDVRSADAVATAATDLYILSRRRFDEVAQEHPRMAQGLFAGLARALARRLRQANAELRVLQES